MLHHWLLILISWFGTVSLQYINSGAPGTDIVLDSSLQYPLPFANYLNLPTTNDYETIQNLPHNEQIGLETAQAEIQRKRRTVEEKEEPLEKRWLPNVIDTDQSMYLQNGEQVGSPSVMSFAGMVDEHSNNFLLPKAKKYFSPWGGKRDKTSIENMWTWKRATNIREPSMPKRVRFSPWGGKRSGQMIYKPGSKSSKIIFSTTIPELNRIVSNYSSNGERFNFAGFQFIPILDKRHPIKILALSTKMNDRILRDALPFKSFLESLPKIFKPGHTYLDVNLKKDGKRKVKFSAWGGKRSPPIIGPIWTPAPQNLKEATLDTILLIRSTQDKPETTNVKAL